MRLVLTLRRPAGASSVGHCYTARRAKETPTRRCCSVRTKMVSGRPPASCPAVGGSIWHAGDSGRLGECTLSRRVCRSDAAIVVRAESAERKQDGESGGALFLPWRAACDRQRRDYRPSRQGRGRRGLARAGRCATATARSSRARTMIQTPAGPGAAAAPALSQHARRNSRR